MKLIKILNHPRPYLNRAIEKWNHRNRNANPYATHVPVLIGLAIILKPKRIVEFGSGIYSTLTFLNNAVFTELTQFDSYENDRQWFMHVVELVPKEHQTSLHLTEGAVHSVVEASALQGYDLIFVDDSRNSLQRAETIERIVECQTSSPILIHDFEHKIYQKATKNVSHMFIFSALNPNTGIVWNGNRIVKSRLSKLNKVIKSYASQIELDDRIAWLKLLTEKL